MDKDIAAAAIERLEAEKQRRIDEKVAKGEAVRVPLSLVIHDPEQVEAEIESAKASKLAELRKAGETREIVFDPPLTISTGVPRNADFGKGWARATLLIEMYLTGVSMRRVEAITEKKGIN
jgi:hypothetical protein